MADRKKPLNDVKAQVLMNCARRCAFCYDLSSDLEEKDGQIAHIDQDSSNSAEENLAFLCLIHHSNTIDGPRSRAISSPSTRCSTLPPS
jgi:hypothetical protein